MSRHLLAIVLGCFLLPLATGCKGNVIGGAGGTTQNPPECPAQPSIGEPCSADDGPCNYEVASCVAGVVCNGGVWEAEPSDCATECGNSSGGGVCLTVGESCYLGGECGGQGWDCMEDHYWSITYYDELCCNNPVNECPVALPVDGDYCDICSDVQKCEYTVETPCGPQPASVVCGPDDGMWHVALQPAPCDCGVYDTFEACSADPGCRYLSGGCDLDVGGCFPALDCGADGPCPAGTTCTSGTANDCGLDPCVECVAVSVCL
jgi:hypothetical protein